MNHINYSFNILITGNKGVGKTSFIQRYTNKKYNNYSAIKIPSNNTIYLGDNFYDYILYLDNYSIKLNIYDHYNNDDFVYNYNITDAIIIICDITDEKSYNIEEYINNKDLYSNNKVEYYIINNKIDKINFLNDKKEYTQKYHNVSTKTNYGINTIFKIIVRKLIYDIDKTNNKIIIPEHIINYNIKKLNFFEKILKYCI